MKHPVYVFSVLAAALAGVTTSLYAGGVPARFIRLTVTASRPGVDGAPDYANRSWQICDLKLFGNGAEIPLKGAKVRPAFLGLMPYYKGEGLTAWHSWGVRKEGCQASVSAEVSPRRGVPGVHLDTCHPPTHTGRFGDPGPTLPAVSSNRISKGRTQEFPSWFSG